MESSEGGRNFLKNKYKIFGAKFCATLQKDRRLASGGKRKYSHRRRRGDYSRGSCRGYSRHRCPVPGFDRWPPQEQAGVTVSEPGDVVVSFDKIEELMAERRAAARDTVEQAEPAAPEVAAPVVEQAEPPTPEAPAPSQPEKATEQAPEEKPQDEVAAEQKKPRRGRPPKAEKAEQAAPEADKEQTAAKPRRGRPPKADKAAPDEAQPPKPRDKVSQGKKAATVKAAPAPNRPPLAVVLAPGRDRGGAPDTYAPAPSCGGGQAGLSETFRAPPVPHIPSPSVQSHGRRQDAGNRRVH